MSEYAGSLKDAMEAGERAFSQAHRIADSLARHKVLEDEVRALRATIKGIESKRDELVQSARVKISVDEARTVIVERLRRVLMGLYEAYLRADVRTCVREIENLWGEVCGDGEGD